MLGDRIKRLMKDNGYTQKQLAMRSGCTESAISRYVNNERTPRVKILKRLAIALGVTIDELVGGVFSE
jgi:transcriptional regulator with XRE-family HTH domain